MFHWGQAMGRCQIAGAFAIISLARRVFGQGLLFVCILALGFERCKVLIVFNSRVCLCCRKRHFLFSFNLLVYLDRVLLHGLQRQRMRSDYSAIHFKPLSQRKIRGLRTAQRVTTVVKLHCIPAVTEVYIHTVSLVDRSRR